MTIEIGMMLNDFAGTLGKVEFKDFLMTLVDKLTLLYFWPRHGKDYLIYLKPLVFMEHEQRFRSNTVTMLAATLFKLECDLSHETVGKLQTLSDKISAKRLKRRQSAAKSRECKSPRECKS